MGGAAKPTANPGLIADIGGTNARFALLIGGAVSAIEVLKTADYADIGAAIGAYLDRVAPDAAPSAAAFAVASPVTGDHIELTNRDWSFSVQALDRPEAFDQPLAVVQPVDADDQRAAVQNFLQTPGFR